MNHYFYIALPKQLRLSNTAFLLMYCFVYTDAAIMQHPYILGVRAYDSIIIALFFWKDSVAASASLIPINPS